VITYKNFLESEDENAVNFLSPTSPSIIVKELTKETIESAIHYYVKEDNGYWLKFCHMGTEIDEKTLNVLTDRWFAKNSLIDFTTTNESNLMVETESLSNLEWKATLKSELSELKEELLIELGKESEIENSTLERLFLFSKVLLGLNALLLTFQILAVFSK
jgi:hypothetical protein